MHHFGFVFSNKSAHTTYLKKVLSNDLEIRNNLVFVGPFATKTRKRSDENIMVVKLLDVNIPIHVFLQNFKSNCLGFWYTVY